MTSGLSKNLLIGILALAVGTRLGIAVLTESWAFPSDNNFWQFGYEMGQIAASLAMGNGFSWPEWSNYPPGPTSWMAPVYPLIMATTFKIFGTFSYPAAIALILFLTAASALSCLLLYFIGERLYNPQVGLLAAFLLAIYPPSIHFAVRNLWDTSLFTCCVLVIILMFLKLADHPSAKGGISLGIILGVTALINPVIVVVYPAALIWLYLKSDGNQRTIIKATALTLIVFCLTISPWLVRNYLVFGQFTFIKSNFGHELFKGTDDKTRDNEEELISRTQISTVFTESERQFLEQSDEITRNKFLLQKGITFILDHPLLFAEQSITRFVRFWTYIKPQNGWRSTVTLLPYAVTFTLGMIGLLLTRTHPRDIKLIFLFLIFFPLPYYFTIVRAFRYRFPIETIIMVFAAYTIYRILARYQLADLRRLNRILSSSAVAGSRSCSDKTTEL